MKRIDYLKMLTMLQDLLAWSDPINSPTGQAWLITKSYHTGLLTNKEFEELMKECRK